MESLKLKYIILCCFSLSLFSVYPATKKPRVKMISLHYYKNLFGHIHKNPSRYSQSLSTIGCNHPVKIMGIKGKPTVKSGFYLVSVGPYRGYIKVKDLSKKRVKCFQSKYPRFFDSIDLSLTEMYYWGRLYDLYNIGKSKVR